MAVTHGVSTRNLMTDYITEQLSGGTLVFVTDNNIPVATLRFGSPAFNPAIEGTAICNEIESDASAVGGTVARAIAYDSDGHEVLSCSVTALPNSSGDIVISYGIIATTQSVQMSSLTYSAAP